MPNPAAELTLTCFHLSEEAEVRADEVIREMGFHSFEAETWDGRRIYTYQPFEIHERNKALIEDCLDALQAEFPQKDVWLEDWRNRNSENPASHSYTLNIAPDRKTAGASVGPGVS